MEKKIAVAICLLGTAECIDGNLRKCASDFDIFLPNQQMLLIRSPQDHPPTPRVDPGVIPGERGQAFARKCLRSGHFLVIHKVKYKLLKIK